MCSSMPICALCSGPIDPGDTHPHCAFCLGLAHAEEALSESNCPHCEDFPVRVLRARRAAALGEYARQRPAAASEPLAGPPPLPPRGDKEPDRRQRSRPPGSPVFFADESLRPADEAAEVVRFGASGDDDELMSLAASDRDLSESEELGETEKERAEWDAPPALHEELVRVLTRAVQDLGLEWDSPDEPAKSKLDTWFLQQGRRAAAQKKRAPFFPDVHEEVVKAWSAPQSARTHASGSAIFSLVDGAETRGYARIPPVEQTIAAHLCPSTSSLRPEAALPSKPCRMTAHIAEKAYAASGEAASALHTMAVLQVFQAQLLRSLDGNEPDPDGVRDLRAATDFALMATKRTAQAIGRSMGFMVALHRHLWLTLADLKEADKRALLNAPLSPAGLFGDAVDAVVQRFAEDQKRSRAMSQVLPRRSAQPPSRHRSSSARSSQRPVKQPMPAAPSPAAAPEPTVRPKQWRDMPRKRHGPRKDRRPGGGSASRPKPSS